MGSNCVDCTNLSPDLSFRRIPKDKSQADKMESTLFTVSSSPIAFDSQKKENDQEPNLVPLQIIKTEIPEETSTNKRGRRKPEKKHNRREKSILDRVEMDRFLTQWELENFSLLPLSTTWKAFWAFNDLHFSVKAGSSK
ncbi:hypothetical protein E2320_014233 [Naja naja]|nr:hypothetical protein E2320_014233 [Naja naja]